ncbi:uncharacterized protein LOC113637679 isoform X2 [Tachysurus fulvidraco]|uniref:uncharacterized protein LOC113637679 isoform X2 n=1 Tax=Tachysurus fulvidraco TaxID=1234273 RepID=UPI001FEDFD72|nr:uncharacterized protein LOC113637679 isoform X2 [Tachysurus fulvidraco]
MNYSRKTLVSDWHKNRESEPKDCEYRDGQRQLHKSTYKHFGTHSYADWRTTTQIAQSEKEHKAKDPAKSMSHHVCYSATLPVWTVPEKQGHQTQLTNLSNPALNQPVMTMSCLLHIHWIIHIHQVLPPSRQFKPRTRWIGSWILEDASLSSLTWQIIGGWAGTPGRTLMMCRL